jgi:hypothetical protein
VTRRVPGNRLSSVAPPGHALDLLRSALDVAELLVEHVVEPGAAASQPRDFTKEVGEVAMLLRMAARVQTDEPDLARTGSLAARLAPFARGQATRNAIVRRPSRAAAHLLAHACLQQVGNLDPAFDELARSALGSSAAAATERVPYRLLDTAWIRHLVLGDGELDHPALALSPIGVGVDLIGATTDDAYAFSHALPYATDFGRHQLSAWTDRERLAGIADALALKALAEDDLDLLGELLMAPALLRTPWTSIQWFGWRVLSDTWREYGFVPGPGLPAAASGETAAQAVDRVLGTVYHTTLVGGLLVATLLFTGWWPPPRPPAAPPFAVRGSDHGPRARAWQRVWADLDDDGREALGAVPAGIALHRGASDTDVVTMVEALRGPAIDLLPAPLVMQVAELLNRLAVALGTGGGKPGAAAL